MRPVTDTERFALISTSTGAASPLSTERTNAPRPSRPRLHRPLWGELWRWTVVAAIFTLVAPPLLGLALVGAIYRQSRIDQTRPVEAIVVLGTVQNNGQPGPILRARLERVLAVYEANMAPLIVVTGGRAPGDEFTEAEAAEAWLLERGVPAEAIVLENEGRNSWQSMRGVATILNERGLNRVLLVSDGFHLLRLKLMARDLGLDAYVTAAVDSPIRQGGGNELNYMVREAAGIVAHLWDRR